MSMLMGRVTNADRLGERGHDGATATHDADNNSPDNEGQPRSKQARHTLPPQSTSAAAGAPTTAQLPAPANRCRPPLLPPGRELAPGGGAHNASLAQATAQLRAGAAAQPVSPATASLLDPGATGLLLQYGARWAGLNGRGLAGRLQQTVDLQHASTQALAEHVEQRSVQHRDARPAGLHAQASTDRPGSLSSHGHPLAGGLPQDLEAQQAIPPLALVTREPAGAGQAVAAPSSVQGVHTAHQHEQAFEDVQAVRALCQLRQTPAVVSPQPQQHALQAGAAQVPNHQRQPPPDQLQPLDLWALMESGQAGTFYLCIACQCMLSAPQVRHWAKTTMSMGHAALQTSVLTRVESIPLLLH
jgi:hypothetical protein